MYVRPFVVFTLDTTVCFRFTTYHLVRCIVEAYHPLINELVFVCMNIKVRLLTFFVLYMIPAIPSYAQVDTLKNLGQQLHMENLDMGLKQYLTYVIHKESKKVSFMAIWNRTATFETVNGNEVITVYQNLIGDERFQRTTYSQVNRNDFTSIFHKTEMAGKTEAFNFSDTRVWGADSVVNNEKAGFEVEAKPYTLNWELDLEVLEILPYADGKKFAIHFYHPGGQTPPKFYLYDVIGSEQLNSAGVPVDCWKLKIIYDDGVNNATFWVAKQSRQVLKMEEHYNNIIRYKVRMGTDIASSS